MLLYSSSHGVDDVVTVASDTEALPDKTLRGAHRGRKKEQKCDPELTRYPWPFPVAAMTSNG